MEVMLTENCDKSRYFVNGTIGTVTNVEKRPIIVTLTNGNILSIYLLFKENGTFYYPIKAGYCTTIYAFADDLILIANDENCARELLKLTTNFFAERSMKINGKKCFSLIEPGNVTKRQISHLCCNPKIFYRRTTDYSDHRDKLL